MSRTKDHYTCKSCGELDEEVPSNGGWCERCGAHHGWTHLAEGSSEMGSLDECLKEGKVIIIDEPEPELQRIDINITPLGIELRGMNNTIVGLAIHFHVHIVGCGRDEQGIMIMEVMRE